MLVLELVVSCGFEDQKSNTSSSSPSTSSIEQMAQEEEVGDEQLLTKMRDAGTCQAGVDAFAASVHPLVRERCATCHNGAIPRAPAFAVADPANSYAVVLSRINFDELANSVFVRTGGNMHCQAYGTNCRTNQDDIMNVVRAWWENGEKTCPRKGHFFTETVTMPANLPARNAGFTALRFPLASIDRTFGAAVFEVEAQLFAAATTQTAGAYRFRMPRLATPDKTLHINNVKILINGKYNPSANAYTSVDQVVKAMPMPTTAAAPLPHPVLSSKSLITGQERATGDTVSISFEVLNEAPVKTCKALPTFKTKVLPVVNARNCQACHGGATVPGRAPANLRFNMALNEEQLCAAFLQRIDPHYAYNSVVIDYPLRGANQHPRIIPQIEEINPAWTDWMALELAPTPVSPLLDAPTVTYADTKTIFDNNCVRCHNPNFSLGGLNLANFPFITGTQVGHQPDVVANILGRVKNADRPMPPMPSPLLSAQDIAMIQSWLDGGLLPAPTADTGNQRH